MIITRNTVQREIILQTVLNMDNHPSADDVYENSGMTIHLSAERLYTETLNC